MFKKTHLKIFLGISIFIMLFIIIENIIVYISINNINKPNIHNSIKESINLACNNVDSYLELTSNYIENTLSNKDIITSIRNNDYSLNSLKIPSLSIIGVVLYETNYNYFYSDGMGGIVSLNDLRKNQKINDFIENDNLKSMFSVRDDYINSNYVTNLKYDKSYGIISYISKIYTNDILTGYLFVDISPKDIFNTFLDFSTYSNMKNSFSKILTDNASFLDNINNNQIKDSDNYYTFTYNGKLSICTYIPKCNIENRIFILYLPVFIASFVILIITICIALFYSNKVTKSLIKLNTKMNNVDNLFNKKNT